MKPVTTFKLAALGSAILGAFCLFHDGASVYDVAAFILAINLGHAGSAIVWINARPQEWGT